MRIGKENTIILLFIVMTKTISILLVIQMRKIPGPGEKPKLKNRPKNLPKRQIKTETEVLLAPPQV